MKSTYIWGVIGIVVVIGLGMYAWNLDRNGSDTDVIGEAFERTSIDDLIGGDKAYVCDVHSAVEGAETLGSVYIEGDAFRAEFKAFVPEIDTTIDVASLWDGMYVYSWSSLSPVGSRAAITRDQITFDNASGEAAEQVTYTCNEVAPDPSMLAVPENITFEEFDVEAVMQNQAATNTTPLAE